MKTPTEFQINRLMQVCGKKLPERKLVHADAPSAVVVKTAPPVVMGTRDDQRKVLSATISKLEQKLQKLDQLIKQREQAANAVDRQSLAKKERAVKEKDKPKSAAEKAKINRENKRFRDQKLKNQTLKHNGSSGGSSPKPKKDPGSEASLPELKSLATRVRGQLAIAKQKLAAL
jgi:hypothetical protein